jgi:hypothetical protein
MQGPLRRVSLKATCHAFGYLWMVGFRFWNTSLSMTPIAQPPKRHRRWSTVQWRLPTNGRGKLDQLPERTEKIADEPTWLLLDPVPSGPEPKRSATRTRILISVPVPVEPEWIAECRRALPAEEHRRWEVIIHEAGSPDVEWGTVPSGPHPVDSGSRPAPSMASMSYLSAVRPSSVDASVRCVEKPGWMQA